MKNFKFLLIICVLSGCIFAACSDDNDNTPGVIKDYTTVIVNQGNFTEKNGSISLYEESSNRVLNLAFEKSNANRPLAALVESFTHNGRIGLAVCNSPDKVVVVDMEDLSAISPTLQGGEIVSPRYAVLVGSYAYISCWGEEMKEIGQYPGGWGAIYSYCSSYILKVNIVSSVVEKTIPCGADVEGLMVYNDKLYAAIAGGVKVFSLSNDSEVATILHRELEGNAKHFAIDKNGKLWYSVLPTGLQVESKTSGLVVVNTSNHTIEQELAIDNIGGCIALSKSRDKLLYISTDYVESKSELFALDVATKSLPSHKLYSGRGLVGVAVNPRSGYIYTAEVNDYVTNSILKVLKEDGTSVQEQVVGVAASRFVFLN